MAGIPITAYAVCNALGSDRAAVRAAMHAGRSGLGSAPMPPSLAEWEGTCGAVAGELPPLPSRLGPYDTRQGRLTAMGLAELEPAVAAAVRRWGADRIALIIGTSTGGVAATERAYDTLLHGGSHPGELPSWYDLDRSHAMQATVDVARFMTGVGGPGHVISTACSSSAKAMASAARLIALGLADAVIAGGVDTLCELTLRGFHSLEVLSPRPCRPFCAERSGINIGEGAAFVLLEREGAATTRLLAVGETSDAHHMSAPHPQGAGALAAMAQALQRGGVQPTQVDQVNAHATGTKLNDAAEALAIGALLGPDVPVVATKGYTGHLLGAAGATEVVLSIMSIEDETLWASVGSDPLDPELAVRVNRAGTKHRSRHVLSNSFAFGGSNAAVLLQGVDP